MAQLQDISGETYYQIYINEAPFIPADHAISPDKLDIPNADLYDQELIEKGKQFVRRNLFGVAVAQMMAGLASSVDERVRNVLLRQGGVHLKETAFKRYLVNVLRIHAWYRSDFTNHDTHATKDLNAVRASHGVVVQRHPNIRRPQLPPLSPDDSSFLKGIQQVTSGIDDTDFPRDLMREDHQVPVSQFDLVNGQYVFIAPFLLYPEGVGVHDTQGLEGFVRLWSLIGRQLGIQDRFNIALHYERTGGKTDAFRLIEQRIIMACLKQVDDTALNLWKAMLEGLAAHSQGVIRFKPAVQLMLKAKGLPTHLLDEHMDWRDRVSSRFLNFFVGELTKWAAGRLALNSAVRFYFWLAAKKYLKERNFGKR